MALANCWTLKACGREKGGLKAGELGVCIAAEKGLGRSCWAVAGTLCGGAVQGTVAQKENNCMGCEVYRKYNRTMGAQGKEVARLHPDEEQRYKTHLMNRRR